MCDEYLVKRGSGEALAIPLRPLRPLRSQRLGLFAGYSLPATDYFFPRFTLHAPCLRPRRAGSRVSHDVAKEPITALAVCALPYKARRPRLLTRSWEPGTTGLRQGTSRAADLRVCSAGNVQNLRLPLVRKREWKLGVGCSRGAGPCGTHEVAICRGPVKGPRR